MNACLVVTKNDRARLPLPELNFSSLSINDKPKTELEIELEIFWCQLLKIDNIPCYVNLIRLGANSFHFMLATNYYCCQWLSDQPQIDLSIFFREATIFQHAQFLASHTKIISTNLSRCLLSHITEGISFE